MGQMALNGQAVHHVQISLFGPTVARTRHGVLAGRDFGGVKQRRILALLALRRAVSKAELAELLWEGSPPPEYVATLESYVSVLRRRLDPTAAARDSIIVTRTGGYSLDPSRVEIDLDRFEALLSAAGAASPARALPLLEEAMAVADEPLLADDPYPTWADDARERVRAQLADAATRAGEYALILGATERARTLATQAIDLEPLAEPAWRVRMAAHAAAGDWVAAMRCHAALRQRLADELGVGPAPETQRLYARISRACHRSTSNTDVPHLVAQVLAAARRLAVTEGAGDRAAQLLHDTECLVRGLRTTRSLTPHASS